MGAEAHAHDEEQGAQGLPQLRARVLPPLGEDLGPGVPGEVDEARSVGEPRRGVEDVQPAVLCTGGVRG